MSKFLIYVVLASWLSTPGLAQSAPPGQPPDTAKQENQAGKTSTGPSDPAQPMPSSNKTDAAVDTKSARQHDPQTQCVKPKEFAVALKSARTPVGHAIVYST